MHASSRRVLAVALVALAVVPAARGARPTGSPIRVKLTAESHDPHPSTSPRRHWWYCVRVRTADGASVASMIHVQILRGRTPVEGVGLIWLKRGYDHWCQALGGEANVLEALPRGRRLLLQAVVRADGVTVKRNWPIVVR